MADQHVFDRYTAATKAEEQARAKVTEMVAKITDIGEQLRDWQNIAFIGTTPDGTFVRNMDTDAKNIDFNQELPSLLDIHLAKLDWHKARDEIRGAIQAMTVDQRRTLGISQD